jgi:hypothetical protein
MLIWEMRDQSVSGGNYDNFDLSPQPVLVLKHAVPLTAFSVLPNAKDYLEFLRISTGTVFSVEPEGFSRLLHLVLAFNPRQANQMQQFISKARASLPFSVGPKH